MSYVVARRMRGGKALAVHMDIGPELSQFKSRLCHLVDRTDIEIMTISRPEAFSEYGPYVVCQTIAEFEAALDEMIENYNLRDLALEAHISTDAARFAYYRAEQQAQTGHRTLVEMVMNEQIKDADSIAQIVHDLVGGMRVDGSLCYLGDCLISWLAEHRPDVRKAALRFLEETPFHWLGYTGSVKWSEADGVYYGKVQNIDSLVSYEGNTLEELTTNFYAAVADYIKLCRILKNEPETPGESSHE